jgi:hypothetical protein
MAHVLRLSRCQFVTEGKYAHHVWGLRSSVLTFECSVTTNFKLKEIVVTS